jgi:predicted N-formylglutamate amidohydrolase
MQPVTLSPAAGRAPLVLSCEHASAAVPPEYANLGLTAAQVADHIGWDIGAAAVTTTLSARLGVPAVLSAASRLLVDCNRDLGDADLIPHTSHGVEIPANAAVDGEERSRRLARFYDPYHAAIDAQLAGHPGALLLSVHSFTPELNGCARTFDVGVLFDQHDDLAQIFARDIAGAGFAVRMNEPYSGLEGLIFSARSHGRRHAVPYLEVEINNRLLRRDRDAIAIAARLADAVGRLSEQSAVERRSAISHKP